MPQTIVFSTTVTLTDAQTKALPTTAVEVVATPGANKALIPISATVLSNLTSVYTNIDANSTVYFRYTGTAQQVLNNGSESAGGSVSSIFATPYNGVANFAQRVFNTGSTLEVDAGINQAQVINKGVELFIDNQSSGNLTGGNAANSLVVTVLFAVIDL